MIGRERDGHHRRVDHLPALDDRTLLARADAALYAAKRGARGSWRLAEPAA